MKKDSWRTLDLIVARSGVHPTVLLVIADPPSFTIVTGVIRTKNECVPFSYYVGDYQQAFMVTSNLCNKNPLPVGQPWHQLTMRQ